MTALSRGARPYLLLTLVCALVYLPGLAAIPPLDRDEARFAQATAQMLESGDYVAIRFQDQPRNKKPAGIHWLQAASVALLGTPGARAIWPYRVPSVLGAWAAVLLTFATGALLFARAAALLGAALLAVSLLLVAEAHQAKTDAVLLATVAVSAWGLARVYLGRFGGLAPAGWGPGLAFWAGLGGGALIKGPVGPAVLVLTLGALALIERRGRWLADLRPLAGIPLALAIPLPWLIAVSLGPGAGFVGEAVSQDLLAKILGAAESHGAPPGAYVAAMPATFWPGSLLVPAALVGAWRARRSAAVRFCLAWLVPAWAMFELVPTKLPHYVLPTYPALALLVGAALAAAPDWRVPWAAWPARLYAALWALLGLAAAAALGYAPAALGRGFDPIALPGCAALAAAALAGAVLAWRGRPLRAAAAACAAGALALAWTAAMVAPGLDRLWPSRAVAEALGPRGPDAPPVAATGYREPSLVFLLGTGTLLTDPAGAAAHLAAAPGARAVVEARRRAAFLAALDARGLAALPLRTIEGINYSRGQDVRLTIYTARRRGNE